MSVYACRAIRICGHSFKFKSRVSPKVHKHVDLTSSQTRIKHSTRNRVVPKVRASAAKPERIHRIKKASSGLYDIKA